MGFVFYFVMEKQKMVLECFNGDKSIELSKQDIIKRAGLYYYHNTNKHAGDVLSRMVNSGLLIRVRNGVFRLGSGRKGKPVVINPNQLTII